MKYSLVLILILTGCFREGPEGCQELETKYHQLRVDNQELYQQNTDLIEQNFKAISDCRRTSIACKEAHIIAQQVNRQVQMEKAERKKREAASEGN